MTKSKITNEELVLLVAQGFTVPEIASKKGMNHSSIRERIKKLNLTPVNAHKKKQSYKGEDMIRLCEQGLSQAEIGRELGLTQQAVLYGVNRLKLSCVDGKSKQRKYTDEDLLKLIEKGLNKDQIAYELDANESSVRLRAEKLKVKLLTKTETKEQSQRNILQQCIDEELSPSDAAKEHDIAVFTILYWESKYGMKLKDGREDVGERISEGRTHSEKRAKSLLKERTNDAYRLAEGENYIDSHQSYRFYCVTHREIHTALWTQIAYGNSGLKCCGEANRLLQGNDSIPENFINPGDETWVYLYETSVDGFCKVGVSVDVERRAHNGGKVVYKRQYNKVLCESRLKARLIEEATLWESRGHGNSLPLELLNQAGWSEIIYAKSEIIWEMILGLFDAYEEEETASNYCDRYLHLDPLTTNQIKDRCENEGIDWTLVK